MNSSTTATVHSESIQAQPVVSSQLQDQSYSSSRKLKANKIRVPFKGTEITNSDFHSVHGEEVRNSTTKTHIEFKDRGEIPRSLPNGEDINNTNTANLIFPKRVEESSAFSPREDASSHSGGLGAAPLRTSHLENTRRGESVPPFESGWWRPASETRNMKRNEIIITQHHGPSVNPLVEAISTIAKGDMPYNFQIIQTIDNTILALQTERNFSGTKLSPQGAKISVDLEDAMMKLRAFILSKNHDEKLQQLFAHTKSSAIHTTGVVVGLGKNQDLRNRLAPDAEMREKAQTSLQLAKQLGRDIIASSDFRSLIVDIIRTFHEVSTRSINPKAKSLKRDLGRVVDAFEKGESFTSLSRQMKEALIPSKSEALPQNRVGQQSVLTRDAMGNVVVAPNQTAPLNNDIEFTMTAEQQDRIAKRLRLLLARFGANENFKASATTLFHLLESMLERTSQALDNEGASVKGLKERDDIQKSWDDLKELLERFTAGRSLDPLIDLIKRLVNAVKTDEVAKQWLRDLRAYARNIWNNPQLIEDDSSVQQSRDLIRRAREILSSERYSSLTDAISKETSELAEAMKQDPQRKALAESFSRLTDTMFFSGGSISMFTIQESAAQLRHLLLPLISKQLEHIEIPQIEIYTPTHDIAFRNLIFSGSEILPHNITLDMSSGMNFNVREEGTNFARAKIMMTIRNVKLDIKNVDFYYQRKVLPKISDAGRLEMGLGGQGLSLMLEWTADLTSGQDFTLVCTRAACGIDKMNVSINSSRNFLTKVGTTLFKKQIKNALEKVVAENLVQGGIRASQSINRMVLKRKEDKLLRHKKEAMKREARAQRRLEKEANIKAKKMLKEERKLMEEQQRRIIRSDSERSASLAAQTQPVAPTVIPFATSANRSSLTASEIIAEKTAGAIPIDQVPAIGQISAMESKQPLSFSGKQETVGLPMVGSPALQRANQPIGVPLAN